MSKADVSSYLTRQTTFGDAGDFEDSSQRSSSVTPSQSGMSHHSQVLNYSSAASSQSHLHQQYQQQPYQNQGLAPNQSMYPAPLRPGSADRRSDDASRGQWGASPPPQQMREGWSNYSQQQQQQQQPSWTANDQRGGLPSQVSVKRTDSGGAQLVYDPYAPKSTGAAGNGHVVELA